MLFNYEADRFFRFANPCVYRGIVFVLLCAAAACEKSPENPKSVPPVVKVAVVEQQKVPEDLEFVGSIESIQSVELLARVEGFLQSRNFQEGSDVNKGDLLYEIDPAPFEAALKQAEGELAENQAALVDAKAKLERQSQLVAKDFVSRQAFDNFQASVKEYEGKVTTAKAAVEQARLNLGYCSMYAPFSGRIGYTQVNVGNLVGPDKNPKLAELVKLDPIYVDFRPSQNDLPVIQAKQNLQNVPVSLLLDGNIQYPQRGSIQTIDNKVDPETNTIRMRAVVPNPGKTLVPGEFARVQVHLGVRQGLLVPQQAVEEQQGGFQVFVLKDDNTVEAAPVEVGRVVDDRRVIESGLKPGLTVVVSGLRKLKSGVAVKVERNTASVPAEAAPASVPAAESSPASGQ